jgi:hypothetical protein
MILRQKRLDLLQRQPRSSDAEIGQRDIPDTLINGVIKKDLGYTSQNSEASKNYNGSIKWIGTVRRRSVLGGQTAAF